MANKIKITLKKSLIGSNQNQRKVAKSLGLTKVNQVVEHFESDMIKGMVRKINHLVSVSE